MALTPVAARTYLQLVQDLFREVGAAGTQPVTTVNATGEALRLVNYIHDAELEIQNMWVDWKWLRKTLPFYTAAANQTGIFLTATGATTAYPVDVAEWDWKSFQIMPAGSTSWAPLQTSEWSSVRSEIFNLTSYNQPWRVIVMPDNTFRFDNIPDQAYACQCEYRAVPYDLKVDGDVSNIPPRFANRLIVEWARLKYGLFEGASEQIAAAKLHIYGTADDSGIPTNNGALAALENDQLPNRKNSRRQQGNDIVISTDYGGGYDGWDQGHGNW